MDESLKRCAQASLENTLQPWTGHAESSAPFVHWAWVPGCVSL